MALTHVLTMTADVNLTNVNTSQIEVQSSDVLTVISRQRVLPSFLASKIASPSRELMSQPKRFEQFLEQNCFSKSRTSRSVRA